MSISGFVQNAFFTLNGHFQNIKSEIERHCQLPPAVEEALENAAITSFGAIVTFAEHTIDAIDKGMAIAHNVRREIDEYIDKNLDPKIATIAKNALSGLPVTLLLLSVPSPLPLILISGYWVARSIGELSTDAKDIIDTGIAMRCFARATQHFCMAAVEQSPARAVAGVIEGIIGTLWMIPNE